MSVREALRESTRLTRMRLGQDVFEWFEFTQSAGDGSQIRAAMVPLTEAEVQRGLVYAATFDLDDSTFVGGALRNRAAQQHDVWVSLREPEDLERRVFETVEEMTGILAPADIDRAVDQLSLLMDYASPTVDGLTDKDLDDLKKAFAATEWSALTGLRWAAVKLCCLHLVPELLQVKLSGSSSTAWLTQTSESDESTSNASPS